MLKKLDQRTTFNLYMVNPGLNTLYVLHKYIDKIFHNSKDDVLYL